ncbi:pyridoxal-dependent decarboxylase [Burkholderia latens]|uniref:Histidine decarboxylase n=1 Tax=Burkholderia latens TaxID=488446 RepID=A0A6H9TVD7_9BURK|nr:pyridoxal-dependent decarboxylase [Burkholderia latens]KAB0644172.1 histidine decarboxylase [Burkholderia latens]VWB44421.1 Histidine decarboxylase [Burkholderia latens]
MLNADDQALLKGLYQWMRNANARSIGRAYARGFDVDSLAPFLALPAADYEQSLGFECSDSGPKRFEQEIKDFFVNLFRGNHRECQGNLTGGEIEGNVLGLHFARKSFPNGIVYFSRESRRSIRDAIYLLGLRHVEVKVSDSGEMDYEDLCLQVRARRRHPAIVVANIGSDLKEGRDDIAVIRRIMADCGMEDIYIHCDASLCGPYAPFVEPRSAFDFSDGADSITVCGHYFLGSPVPCGIFLRHQSDERRATRGYHETSLCDWAPVFLQNHIYATLTLWHTIREHGVEGIRTRFVECNRTANEAKMLLNAYGIDARCNPGAITVFLPAPAENVRRKWQMPPGDVSHFVVTPGTGKAQIEELIRDITRQQS